jgi:hypothetical protein
MLPLLSRSRTHESIEPTSESSRSHIHVLNADVLLHVFYLFRLDIRDEEWDKTEFVQVPHWGRQRWWYRLAQVCQ